MIFIPFVLIQQTAMKITFLHENIFNTLSDHHLRYIHIKEIIRPICIIENLGRVLIYCYALSNLIRFKFANIFVTEIILIVVSRLTVIPTAIVV